MNNDTRLQALKNWLSSELKSDHYDLSVASADASFRRYFRIEHNDKSYIAMDAPPEKEDCQPFVDIAKHLFSAQINAPEILAEDHNQGFLLLSDLGNTQYLSILNDETADDLYKDAINTLVKIQSVSSASLPAYDRELLQTEMNLMPDWFLQQHLKITLKTEHKQTLENICECLIENALQQPQVFVHRDYHSRNLMQTPVANPGVLDFQDAVAGAVTYDLASLLKDCYVSWPRQQIEEWVGYYLQLAHQHKIIDPQFKFDDVIQWFDFMALQRHIKVVGIFARLNIRDKKPAYMNDIPLTFQYIIDCCERYPILAPLKELLQELKIAEHLNVSWKKLP